MSSRKAEAPMKDVEQVLFPIGRDDDGNLTFTRKTVTFETVALRPELAIALCGGDLPVGMNTASDRGGEVKKIRVDLDQRPRYPSRDSLMEDKKLGKISGDEWWFRPEYMRLSQVESRTETPREERQQAKANR